MKKQTAGTLPIENKVKQSTFITVVCDLILIVALIVCLMSYISHNNAETYNQNISNITSIATAKSELMLSALNNTSYEVQCAYRYCNGKKVDEILDYLSLISDENNEYQLLTRDEASSSDLYHVYTGFSTKMSDGKYLNLKYKNTDLANSIYLHASYNDGEISFSQSFTNVTDALRYFAVFCRLDVNDNGEIIHYYLIKPQRESRMLDQIQTYSQYQQLTTAICYSDGKYLARDVEFRSDIFYDYLYDYNDLSIDEKNAIRSSVQNDPDGTGVLTFRDYKGRDCVFAYVTCNDVEDWDIIVAVPVSEFVSPALLSFFPLIIIIFLAFLLAFNIWRLLLIVRQLRHSLYRERIASSSKSSFLSRMSHEIRTPLNAIIGYNTIAKMEITDAKTDLQRRQAEMKVLDCIEKNEIASKHLLTIVNDVLDMSAIESGKISVFNERFDFKGLITSLTTIFYSQAKTKGVDFEVAFDTITDEWFIGDQLRTNQILTNLLSNAIKFTPDGGFVELRICQLQTDTAAPHIRFKVNDTGIGMTEEYLARLWTPFEQEDTSISRRFGGTGLGLSITKNLLDLMGGTITVKSVPGSGTSFTIDLTYEYTEQTPHTASTDFRMINSMIIGSSSTSDYIKSLFDRCNARCSCITDADEAVKTITDAKEKEYSLLLVDWSTQQTNGLEIITRVREKLKEKTPVVVLAAYDYSDLADAAVKAGINRFISKPMFQTTIYDLLTGIHDKKYSRPVRKYVNADFSGVTILLAEDNKMNMEISKRFLTSAGMDVQSAWNGKEAVEIFESSSPGTFSAILMDIHMPIMNGHDATRTIRNSSHPDACTIPIIAMTADAFAENVVEAHNAGMNDHIAKPINLQTVFTTLSKYIPNSK